MKILAAPPFAAFTFLCFTSRRFAKTIQLYAGRSLLNIGPMKRFDLTCFGCSIQSRQLRATSCFWPAIRSRRQRTGRGDVTPLPGCAADQSVTVAGTQTVSAAHPARRQGHHLRRCNFDGRTRLSCILLLPFLILEDYRTDYLDHFGASYGLPTVADKPRAVTAPGTKDLCTPPSCSVPRAIVCQVSWPVGIARASGQTGNAGSLETRSPWQ